MTKAELKKIIFEAFKDVPKGTGQGARACNVEDSYGTQEEFDKATAEDTEQHWWEYPDDVRKNCLDYALSYNNKDGKKFHLPALMTADIDGLGNSVDVAVYLELCQRGGNEERAPHHGHPEIISYLKKFNVQSVINYYQFDKKQVHAVALYLLYLTKRDDFHYKFSWDRKKILDNLKREQEDYAKHAGPPNYTLTFDDVIAIHDEEYRIFKDWLAAGGVDENTEFQE